MRYEVFDRNRSFYGQNGSWAVWDQGSCEHMRYQPDAHVAPSLYLNRVVRKLNGIDSQEALDKLGWILNPNVVLVALNFAERDGDVKAVTDKLAFHSFHEETSTTSDGRLRDVCCGTKLWGGYITDLVKMVDGKVQPIRNSTAAQVRAMLRDPEFRKEQVDGLVREIRGLGAESPTLIALGNDVFDVLDREEVREQLSAALGAGTISVKITHYSKAAGIRHSDYVARVYKELLEQDSF